MVTGADVVATLGGLWHGVLSFIWPMLILALIAIIACWIIGAILGKAVNQIVKLAKVDNALRAAGVDKFIEKAGFRLDSGMFLGKLVEWFFIVTGFVVAFDIFHLTQVTSFLTDVVLGYLPQVIVAALIILVAAIVAETAQKVVAGGARAANLKSGSFAGSVAKWAIWIFAILAAVMQLGIAVSFINTLFTGIIVAIALALGLSFGLGGQEAAARYIEKVRSDIMMK